MTTEKQRTWQEGLENLGENLVRLGSALRAIQQSQGTLDEEAPSSVAVAQLSATFGLALRQARAVLISNEASFLALMRPSTPTMVSGALQAGELELARSLVREGIHGAQQLVTLLERIGKAAPTDSALVSSILTSSLEHLGDTVGAAGWQLVGVCHEFQAELSLLASPPASVGDLGPGGGALLNDMTSAVRELRASRRFWFRVDHQIASATGVVVNSPARQSITRTSASGPAASALPSERAGRRSVFANGSSDPA